MMPSCVWRVKRQPAAVSVTNGRRGGLLRTRPPKYVWFMRKTILVFTQTYSNPIEWRQTTLDTKWMRYDSTS